MSFVRENKMQGKKETGAGIRVAFLIYKNTLK